MKLLHVNDYSRTVSLLSSKSGRMVHPKALRLCCSQTQTTLSSIIVSVPCDKCIAYIAISHANSAYTRTLTIPYISINVIKICSSAYGHGFKTLSSYQWYM